MKLRNYTVVPNEIMYGDTEAISNMLREFIKRETLTNRQKSRKIVDRITISLFSQDGTNIRDNTTTVVMDYKSFKAPRIAFFK